MDSYLEMKTTRAATCSNTSKPQMHLKERKNSDSKGYICMTIFSWDSGEWKTIGTEDKLIVAGNGGELEWFTRVIWGIIELLSS